MKIINVDFDKYHNYQLVKRVCKIVLEVKEIQKQLGPKSLKMKKPTRKFEEKS